MAIETAAQVTTFGRIGHWPGSFGFSPLNWEAAPSNTEFRSTLTDFALVAMARSGLLRRNCRSGLGTRSGGRGCGHVVLRALDRQPHGEVKQALLFPIGGLHGSGLALD